MNDQPPDNKPDETPNNESAQPEEAQEPEAEHPAEAPEEPAAEETPEQPPAEEQAEETPDQPAEEQVEEAPAEETPSPTEPPYCSDGLEGGLSWFGAEPRVAPLPPGQAPPTDQEAAAAEQEAELRRLRVRQRLEARRREAEAAKDKKWYQRIPLGALSMIPIIIVLIVMVILYPPWGGRVRGPAEKLDDKLLLKEEVKDPQAVLQSLGIEAIGRCWTIIPLAENPRAMSDYAFVMTKKASSAALKLKPPAATNFAASCEIALLDKDPEYGASLALEDSTLVALRSDERDLTRDVVRIVTRRGGQLVKATARHTLKPRWWYKLEVRVEGSTVRYYVNGGRLPTSGERPPGIAEVRIVVFNARIAVRNLKITPSE